MTERLSKFGKTPTEPFYRFINFVKIASHSDCWLWQGKTQNSGYGQFSIGSRKTVRKLVYAHRFSYEQMVGCIPPGMQIDHLCKERLCVNPDHLEVVTPRVNTHRGNTITAKNAVKTACPSGHPYNDANTIVSAGKRYCRTCRIKQAEARKNDPRVQAMNREKTRRYRERHGNNYPTT